ncbi:MAG: Fe-S cluster assembly protein SufD [Caulobacteraceae bacterium]|nr:Fe-S cluster assembly protein SufD [Caulobacter sp.]
MAQAIRANDAALLPSRRDEAFRWTDLRGVLRTVPPASPEAEPPAGGGPFAAIADAQELLVVNGRPLDGRSEPVLVTGETVLKLRVVSRAEGTAHAATLAVDVAPGAHLVLLESYEGEGAGYVAALDLTLRLAEGASVERIVVQADAQDSVSVSTADVTPAPHSRFAQTVVTDGARLQRHETRVTHPGEGCEVRMDAAYVLGGRRHADLTTVVEHRGLNGATTQVAKGVAAERARAVFQGRIVVAHGADGTDARLRHDALLLNDGAEVDAKPELEIYADDVQCAHGNTIGALDDEQLFYMRSRGLPEPEARSLLMQAFLGDVVERIDHEGAREVVAQWIADRLERLGR